MEDGNGGNISSPRGRILPLRRSTRHIFPFGPRISRAEVSVGWVFAQDEVDRTAGALLELRPVARRFVGNDFVHGCRGAKAVGREHLHGRRGAAGKPCDHAGR